MAMNKTRKNAVPAFSFIFILFILSSKAPAQIPLDTPTDTLTRYDNYSRIFYQNLSSEFSLNSIPNEQFLTVLLNGVNKEIVLRKNLTASDLEMASSEQISKDAYYSIESDLGNYFARKFDIWKQYQLRETALQIDRALRLKKKLFALGSAAEQKRMFDFDLNAAVEYMGDKENELAIRLFKHILEFYPYKNIDDVIYYLAETYYQHGRFIEAEENYNKILNSFSDSDYYQPSYYRILTLNFTSEKYPQVIDMYPVYKSRAADWNYKKNVIRFVFGASHFKLGEYEKAREYFSAIPNSSRYYAKAQFFSGHSAYFMNSIDEAKYIFDNLIIFTDNKGDIAEESALMAGDILTMKNEQDQAWGYYRLVPEKSPRYPRALIGQAICHLMRNENDIADSIANIILIDYPNNEYTYMARCLKGKSAKSLGNIDYAAAQYQIVLDESGKKIGLAQFLVEKLKIFNLINELRSSEELYLKTGDETLFSWYWAFRAETEILMNRAIFTEYTEIDPDFENYIDEKLNVMALIDKYFALGHSAVDIQDMRLMEQISALGDSVSEVATMIHFAGLGRIDNFPKYYYVTDLNYNKNILDSLYTETSVELSKLQSDLENVAAALTSIDDQIEPLERARMLESIDEIAAWKSSLDSKASSNFNLLGPAPELDITRWSHIAFHKSMVPGSDFDDLKAKEKRIKNIDSYIQALGSISQMIKKDNNQSAKSN